MNSTIIDNLNAIAKEKNISILYACESGSRAWGFPSPDSDYDVRFIYVYPKNEYLKLNPPADVIQQPIHNELDISGWDIRKSLILLYKSNAPLFEWLHSPIVYLQTQDFTSNLRIFANKSFQALSVCHHYLSMAKKSWNSLNHEHIKLKAYLYTLRALFCCEWIVNKNSIPPVRFDDLLNELYTKGEFRSTIDNLLMLKKQARESELLNRSEHTDLIRVLDRRVDELFKSIPKKLPVNQIKFKQSILDQFFIDILSH